MIFLNHVYLEDTRLRASPRHGGQEVFEIFSVTDPPPSGAAFIITEAGHGVISSRNFN